MECVPSGNVDPATGDCVITRDPGNVQLSVASTPVNTGTLPDPVDTVWLPAQAVMLGGVISVTVKVLVQVLKFSEPSVTVIVMVLTPDGASVPASGDWVITREPGEVQLSVAVTAPVKSGTVAWQLPLALADWFIPHEVITGSVTSASVPTMILAVLPLQLPDTYDIT
jgi:hypothetical protein